MSHVAGLSSGLPAHLRGRDLHLHEIHGRAQFRKVLRGWLRDARGYYYGALDVAEGIARQAGKPPLVTISQDQLDHKVAEAAIEAFWIAERARPSRFRDRLNKAKTAWKADPVNNPGPDEEFGVTVEVDNPALVSVTGTGSDDGDRLAWVAALKLADAYRAALEFEAKRQKDRDWNERHLERLEKIKAVNSGKSATPVRLPSGHVIWPDGIPAKAKRKRSRKRSTSRTVTSPSSSSTDTTDTPPRQWRDLSLEQKCGLMAQSIESEGRGLSITIKLDQKVVKAAHSAKKGPVSHLRERFARVIDRSLGRVPDFVIVAEQGLGQEPHLHGVIDLEDTPENRKAVRHAGEVLSGLPLYGPGRARIVDIQRLENGGFWPGDYTKKFRRSTRRQMKIDRVMAHTQNLGRRAKARHQQTK
ncbi:MAG: hypothetical protein NXI12_08840 [Alphaproteobacteria bacterium]|nr:hypothetical protein [Alphaproteobacteria bacterium]